MNFTPSVIMITMAANEFQVFNPVDTRYKHSQGRQGKVCLERVCAYNEFCKIIIYKYACTSVVKFPGIYSHGNIPSLGIFGNKLNV